MYEVAQQDVNLNRKIRLEYANVEHLIDSSDKNVKQIF